MLSFVAAAAVAATLVVRLGAAEPGNSYRVQVLVSDGSVATANPPDPQLINGWGIAAGPTTPWWVADNATNVSTLYNAAGVKQGLVVQVSGAPTGMVFNGSTTSFRVTNGTVTAAARFIFAAEDGTISGWSPTVTPNTVSRVAVPNAFAPAHGAIYKGLALAHTTTGDFLYASDFHNNHVDVFDSAFHAVTIPGGFVDPSLPKGFAPFGIQNIGDLIYVAYAKQDEDAADEVAGDGLGYISAFMPNGTFVTRVASADALNAPWGMAVAPSNFGRFSGDLLVGNFGNGRINVFDAVTFEPKGHLKMPNGKAVAIDGLWGLGFGNGAAAGPTNALYFAAGPNDEQNGVFGRIDAQ